MEGVGCGGSDLGRGKNQSEKHSEKVCVATPDTHVLSPSLQGEWQLEEERLLVVGGVRGQCLNNANLPPCLGFFLSSHHKARPAFRPHSQAWSSAQSSPPPQVPFLLLHGPSSPAAVSQVKSHLLLPLPFRSNGRTPEGPGHSVIFLSKY